MRPMSEKKERSAYLTAVLSFIVGWCLTIAGFIVPPLGEIDGSILAVLGEAMVYTASVFGITLYFRNEMQKFRREAKRGFIDDEETEEETNSKE